MIRVLLAVHIMLAIAMIGAILVQRSEGGATTVTLGKVEAILPRSEQIPGETHHVNERVRTTVFEVRKSGSRVSVRLLTSTELDPPPYQRGHGAQFQDENEDQQAQLRPEQVVVEVVGAPLFEPGERPGQPGSNPHHRGNAPPGVRIEDSAEAGCIQLVAECAPTGPNRSEADT